MISQTWNIGKAIRPLLSDLVTFVLARIVSLLDKQERAS